MVMGPGGGGSRQEERGEKRVGWDRTRGKVRGGREPGGSCRESDFRVGSKSTGCFSLPLGSQHQGHQGRPLFLSLPHRMLPFLSSNTAFSSFLSSFLTSSSIPADNNVYKSLCPLRQPVSTCSSLFSHLTSTAVRIVGKVLVK